MARNVEISTLTQLIWGEREWLGLRTKGEGEKVRHVRGVARGHQVGARAGDEAGERPHERRNKAGR